MAQEKSKNSNKKTLWLLRTDVISALKVRDHGSLILGCPGDLGNDNDSSKWVKVEVEL